MDGVQNLSKSILTRLPEPRQSAGASSRAAKWLPTTTIDRALLKAFDAVHHWHLHIDT